jgi:broad specificity phosphatase PhoE
MPGKEENASTKIVVVRHAHRHKLEPDEDNGISEKGEEQVKELVESFRQGRLPLAKEFWSSPKKRCVQTLEPMAAVALQKVKIEKLLDEQSHKESSREFGGRIASLVEKLQKASETLYISSHGDVIPEMINEMTGYHVDLRKGQAIVLVKRNNRWELS